MVTNRIHLLGASGSGTTTLGRALAETLGWPHFDTDDYYWQPSDPPFQHKRDPEERRRRLRADLAPHPRWVLSGSLCGWGDDLIPRFDLVVFLWVPPETRLARLRAREHERYGAAALAPGGSLYEEHEAFMAWAAAYDEGGLDIRSRWRHEAWVSRLSCPVLRLMDAGTTEEHVAEVRRQLEDSVLTPPVGPLSLADDFQGTVASFWERDWMPAQPLEFVPDPDAPTGQALAITVRAGDCPGVGGHGEPTERAELYETRAAALPIESEAWYGFSFYLPADFPVVDRRLVVGQWHQPHPAPFRSPLVANRFRDGAFSITREDGVTRVVCFEERREVRGRWLALAYHVRFSPTSAGLLEAWMDGRQVVSYRGPLGYPDGGDRVHFRIGLYRDHLPMPMTMLIRHFRRGGSVADLSPVFGPRPGASWA
jgi:adenylate kinase family enzyme